MGRWSRWTGPNGIRSAAKPAPGRPSPSRVHEGRVRRSTDARLDLIGIYRRIEDEAGTRVAERFLTVAEAAFNRLARLQGLGATLKLDRPSVAGLRCLSLGARFRNYVVIYRPTTDGIEVYRILHGARDIASILAQDLAGGEADDPASP